MNNKAQEAGFRFWITLFLGCFGVHKFMDKKIGLGVLYLFTCGFFAIGWIFDSIQALTYWISLASNRRSKIMQKSKIKTQYSIDNSRRNVKTFSIAKIANTEGVSTGDIKKAFFTILGYIMFIIFIFFCLLTVGFIVDNRGIGYGIVVALFFIDIVIGIALMKVIKVVKRYKRVVRNQMETSIGISPIQVQSRYNNIQPNTNTSNYDSMDGHQFEYFCADILRKNGFTNVEVTQGSGDYGIDVLAEKEGITYAIQCKCYANTVGNKAVQEAFSGKEHYRTMVGAVITNNYFTKAAKETAASNRILLWDRDKLNEMISAVEYERTVQAETVQCEETLDSDNGRGSKQDAAEKELLLRGGLIAINKNRITPEILMRSLRIDPGKASGVMQELEKIGLITKSSNEILMSEDMFKYQLEKRYKDKKAM